MKNYYDILGVSKDSSESDIKKAYRTLSLKYHPDRNSSSDAADKIREINDAYDTLGDATKKNIYNMQLENEMMGQRGVSNMDDFVNAGDINNIFNMLFGGGGGGGFPGAVHHMGGDHNGVHIFHNGFRMGGMPGMPGMPGVNIFQNMQKPLPIIKNINITLEDTYNGNMVLVEVERWIIQNDMKVTEIKNMYINIPIGIDDGEYIIMRDHGNQINDTIKGDIKIGIHIVRNDTDIFHRNGLDLIHKKTITLKEALCGFSFEIQHLNRKLLCLHNNTPITIIKPNYKKVVNGMGMVRDNNTGNLIIEFHIEFPDSLTETQMSQISSIL